MVVGQRVRAKVVKNKVAPPFRVAEFDMMHTDGISYEGDVLDMGIEQKIIARTGAWFRYGDMQLGQGKEKTRVYLKENPEARRRDQGKNHGRRRRQKRRSPPSPAASDAEADNLDE